MADYKLKLMGHYILKEAIEYTKTQTKINSRNLQIQFEIGYHVADNLIKEMNNGGLIKIDDKFPHLKNYIVVSDNPKQIPIMPPDISSEYDRILDEKIEHYGVSRFAYESAASEFAKYHHEFYTEYNKLNPKFNGAVLDTKQIQIMQKEATEPKIGSMVWYQSSPKNDARELGSSSVSNQYPAIVVNKGKSDNCLNLTVFIDNEGIGDAYHRASGTMSRKNVAHVSIADPQYATWCAMDDAIHDEETLALLKQVEEIGFEVAPIFDKGNLEDIMGEYNNKLELAKVRGFDFDDDDPQPTIYVLETWNSNWIQSFNDVLTLGFAVEKESTLEQLNNVKLEYLTKLETVKGYGWSDEDGKLKPKIEELNTIISQWHDLAKDLANVGISVKEHSTFEELKALWDNYLTRRTTAKQYGFDFDDEDPPSDKHLEVYITEANATKVLLGVYGYKLSNFPKVDRMNELLDEYHAELEKVKALGYECSEEDDVTIQMIEDFQSSYEEEKEEKEQWIEKLTKTGHAEAGYLDGEPTIEKLRDLDASYEKLLSNAYDAGLKKKTAKNAKLYTLTQINEALGIKAGS